MRTAPSPAQQLLLLWCACFATPVSANDGAAIGSAIVVVSILVLCVATCCFAGVGMWTCLQGQMPRNFGELPDTADEPPGGGKAAEAGVESAA